MFHCFRKCCFTFTWSAIIVSRAQHFIFHSGIFNYTESCYMVRRRRLGKECWLDKEAGKGDSWACGLSPCLRIKRFFSAVEIVLHSLWQMSQQWSMTHQKVGCKTVAIKKRQTKTPLEYLHLALLLLILCELLPACRHGKESALTR